MWKLTPSWPVARQTSVSLEGKCWGCGDPLRATFQEQLFPGVAAPGLQSEGSPLDSGHGPRQEELVPGAAGVTCQVTLPGAALFMNFGGNVLLGATLVIAEQRSGGWTRWAGCPHVANSFDFAGGSFSP